MFIQWNQNIIIVEAQKKNTEKKEENKCQLKFFHPEITVAYLRQFGLF